MHTDVLIVGLGICGTLLSYELLQLGLKVVAVDRYDPFSSSNVACGLINPVTGMRVAKAWMIDELLPVALHTYNRLEKQFGRTFVSQHDIIECHATAENRELYIKRAGEGAYLDTNIDQTLCQPYLNYHFGISKVTPCYVINVRLLQSVYRQVMLSQGCLVEEAFEEHALIINADSVEYKGIKARRIIFCDGAAGIARPWFTKLPFSLAKGEVLVVDIPGLPREHILKNGIKIAPFDNGLFWVGASFEWKYDSIEPTTKFREQTKAKLSHWLNLPFTVIEHWSSVRPATVDHKPFVGFHPLHPSLGIFNGMGAKGSSQTPFFAADFAKHINRGSLLDLAGDISRFHRILTKS
jgi:glycine/D-amino acid oxidase-like deaminating enzyme